VDDSDVPPAALVAQAARAGTLAASDAPRAIASATRLAPGREVAVSPLLRETPLPVPAWLPMRWPLGVWEACIHFQWGYRILRGVDAPEEELHRAVAAADWLAALTRDGSLVVAVTHGVFRRLLAGRLLAMGWRAGPGRRSYGHWSAWALVARD